MPAFGGHEIPRIRLLLSALRFEQTGQFIAGDGITEPVGGLFQARRPLFFVFRCSLTGNEHFADLSERFVVSEGGCPLVEGVGFGVLPLSHVLSRDCDQCGEEGRVGRFLHVDRSRLGIGRHSHSVEVACGGEVEVFRDVPPVGEPFPVVKIFFRIGRDAVAAAGIDECQLLGRRADAGFVGMFQAAQRLPGISFHSLTLEIHESQPIGRFSGSVAAGFHFLFVGGECFLVIFGGFVGLRMLLVAFKQAGCHVGSRRVSGLGRFGEPVNSRFRIAGHGEPVALQVENSQLQNGGFAAALRLFRKEAEGAFAPIEGFGQTSRELIAQSNLAGGIRITLFGSGFPISDARF